MTTPTLTKMLKVYLDAASVERLKFGKPGEGTVKNTKIGVRHFIQWMNERRESLGYERIGFDEDFPLVSVIKPKLIHRYIADMLRHDVKPVTAISNIEKLQQLFARWVRPYYEDLGWKIPVFPGIGRRALGNRYSRPSPETLKRVKTWYLSLTDAFDRKLTEGHVRLWFVATMMLEFAMRNGDVKLLRRENFVERDGQVFLNYTPHKTAHSSGRMVKWPVHSKLWNRIKDHPLEFGEEDFVELNRQMRSLGFTGPKGAYELRKICVDHVYQKYGAEMATSISGDDIKTIIRYYADPAQPNIGEVMVTDLISD